MSSAVICKDEPLSPLNIDEEVSSWLIDDTFYQTSFLEEDDIKFEDELNNCETKAEVASLLLENLENLIDLNELIKEEPFLDEKILPLLEKVESPSAIEINHPHLIKMEYMDNNKIQFLMKEFDTVYEDVGFIHETLTPPQSPPNNDQQPILLTTLQPLLTTTEFNNNITTVPEKTYRDVVEYPSVVTPQPDIAHELAVVDELVRKRVEDMQQQPTFSTWINSGPSSPNSNSSTSSNFGDCSSSSDDPEWVPEPVVDYSDTLVAPPVKRKRSKPYSRNQQVDKKSRKKEQNKNAATRYRMKKKAEVEVILGEEKELLTMNDGLEGKITEMQREIKYLKGLMRDLFKAKGLIN